MSERPLSGCVYDLLRTRLGDYQSLDQLALAAGQPGDRVLAALSELHRDGAPIERHPVLGCRLVDLPDRLLAWEVQFGLGTRAFGQRLRLAAEVDSTNDEALRLAGAGALEGTVALAEAQRAGRGRRGRTWHSPAGVGLWASLVLYPPDRVAPGFIALLVGLAIALAIRRLTGAEAVLKWPNDVSVADRKVAGVLCERTVGPSGRSVLIAGFGIDVNQERFPSELAATATSLLLATGVRVDRNLLLKRVLEEAERAYLCAAAGGEELILDRARRLCATLGRAVLVELETERVRGRARDLALDGGLELDEAGGRRRLVRAGDVHHLRAEAV